MRLISAAVAVFMFSLILALADLRPSARAQSSDGQEIFRYDTFGDEQLWTDRFRLHEAVQTLTPAQALGVGLKVDADALSPPVIKALQSKQLDVTDPRVTRRLLELNAVVGVIGKVVADRVTSIGITCALCHSTVDDSLGEGIGRRLDGWPNLDLQVGAIAALAPGFPDALRQEFRDWGPGKYDPRHHVFDGTNIIERFLGQKSLPVVLPPAYGLQGIGFETFTGDGPISYWNSYVGVTQMGGHGSFSDPRIGVNIIQKPDRVTPKLAALLAYQLSLLAPPPPENSVNSAAAARGQELFNGTTARCSTCHVPPTYTDVLLGSDPKEPLLHTATEIGATSGYEQRSATGRFRTTPLRALWQHAPYFHDGRAADLLAVVNHYNTHFSLGLTDEQKADLVEFLKSL
jgi:mono/diheme cytochrome c family protein